MNEASNLGMVRGVFVGFFFFLNFQWTKWKTTFDNKSSFLRVSLIPFLWVQGCNAILLAKKQQRKKKQHRRPTRNKKWNKQTRMVFSKKFFFFFSSCTSALSLPEPLYKGQWEASLQQAPQNTAGRDVAGQCWGTELALQGMRPTQELWPTGQPCEKGLRTPTWGRTMPAPSPTRARGTTRSLHTLKRPSITSSL